MTVQLAIAILIIAAAVVFTLFSFIRTLQGGGDKCNNCPHSKVKGNCKCCDRHNNVSCHRS